MEIKKLFEKKNKPVVSEEELENITKIYTYIVDSNDSHISLKI